MLNNECIVMLTGEIVTKDNRRIVFIVMLNGEVTRTIDVQHQAPGIDKDSLVIFKSKPQHSVSKYCGSRRCGTFIVYSVSVVVRESIAGDEGLY